MGSKPASQQTTVNSPPPQVLQQYGQVTGQANQVAQTPYQSYSGPLVAGLTTQQNQGIAGAGQYADAAQPALAGAAGLTLAGAGPANATQFSGNQVGQYMSPYQSQVIGATEAELQNQDTQQAQQLTGNTIGAGAFGGDRAGIAQSALAGQQDLANNSTIANLNNQNYSQALGEFNTQQTTDLGAQQANLARLSSAGLQLGNIGTAAQTAGLQGAGAQLQAGQVAQTTQQAQDTALYNQFLQQQAYPFQTTQWLANISEGIGSNSGGTSTTTANSNAAAPYIGGGLALGSFLLPSSSTPAARGGRIGRDAGGGVGGLVIPYAADAATESSWVPQTGGLTMGPGSRMPTAQPMNGNSGAQNPLSNPLLQTGLKSFGSALGSSALGDAASDALQDLPLAFGMARGGLVRPRRAVGGRFGFGGGVAPTLDASVYSGLTMPRTSLGFASGGGIAPPLGGLTMRRRGYDDGGDVLPPSRFADPLAATNTENWTPEAGLVSQYANQMPAPTGGLSLSPTSQLSVAMGGQPVPSAPAPAGGLTMAGQYANQMPQPTASNAGLGALRTAMLDQGAQAYVDPSQPASGGGSSTYGDLTDAGGAPLPPVRPAGLVAPSSLYTSTMPPAPAGLVGAPTQLASANGGQSFAPPRGSSIWTAPVPVGPAPKGPAPDPADYPVTQAGQTAFIRDYSAYAGGGVGVHPGFALGVANAEGLGAISARNPSGASSVDIDPNTGKPFSFGAFQLNVRDGLGNAARAAGIDPADPAQANLANKFALDYMAKNGLQPWKGDQAVTAYQAGRPVGGGAPAVAAINSASPPTGGLTLPAGGSTADSSGQAASASSPQSGILGGLHLPAVSDATRMALLSAGLGIMASPARSLGAAIGQGGLQGVGAYEKMTQLQNETGLTHAQVANLNSEVAMRPQEIAQKARELDNGLFNIKGTLGINQQNANTQAANVASESAERQSNIAKNLQTPTPAGMLVRDPANPTAAPKLIPWDQMAGNTGAPSAPAGPTGPAAPTSPQAGAASAVNDPLQGVKPPIDPRMFSPEGQKIAAEETTKTLDDARTASQGAQNTKFYLAQMQNALDNLPPTGFLAPGAGFSARVNTANQVNTVLRGLGVGDDGLVNPEAVASGEELKKLTNKMGFELARSMGGREPGFIVQQAVGSVPSGDNSPLGAKRLIAGIAAMSQRQSDWYSFAQNWSAKTGSSVYGASDAFNRMNPPQKYIANAVISTVPPAALEMLKANPKLAPQFDQKYGAGVSGYALSQGQ